LTVLLTLSLGSAAAAGACSSDPAPATDAGTDTSAPTDAAVADTSPPPPDAADAAGPCDAKGKDGLVNDLACTGLYSDVAAKAVAPEAKLYVPGAPFWSDGAEKTRYLALPAGQKIDTSKMDAWRWPVGTKVWKEFKLGGKRIETRHYAKVGADSWVRATYRWNDAETQALRLDKGETLADGYEVPDLQKCDSCHYGGPDQLLGLDAVSLAMPGAQGITLASLAAAGVLTAPPSKTTAVYPEDGTGKAAKAIEFLHANCSSCHSDVPLAGAGTSAIRFALKPSEVLSDTPTAVSALSFYPTAYCTDSRGTVGGVGGLKVLAGGDRTKSAAYLRANLREPTGREQMPPIGTHKIDTVGVGVLGEWIDALPPCP